MLLDPTPVKVLDNVATVDTLSPTFGLTDGNIVVSVNFKSGVGAGAVRLESAPTADYTGTWVNEGTITFSGSPPLTLSDRFSPENAVGRLRISSGVTGGNIDAYVQRSIRQKRVRSVAFSPLQLPNLRIWSEADLSITGLNDNDPITTANDLSGLANHWTQSVGGNKPIYKTGILNGKPVLRFTHIDASDGHWLISPYSPADESATKLTFAAVFKTNNAADGEIMLWAGNSAGNGFGTEDEVSLSLGDGGAGNKICTSFGGSNQLPTAAFTPFNDNNFHIAIGTFDNMTNDGATKNVTIQVDGVAGTPASGTTTNSYATYESNTFWGKPDASGAISRVWNGDMAAVVVCAEALTTAQQLQLYNYWKAKYGL